MRILLIGAYPPPHGGVQSNVVVIRQYLRDRGIPCAVMNLTRHRSARAEGLYHPTSAYQVLKLLFRLNYDVMHVHHGGDLSPRLRALYFICSLIPARKTVLTCHSGGLASSAVGRRARWWSWAGFVFRRYDRIIVVNREMGDLFRRFGVPEARIRLILPFALRLADPDRKLPSVLSDFYSRREPRLLTIGQLEPEYDLKLQMDVMERVLEKHPRAGLAIIGSGSLDDELRQYLRGKPYADNILLCGDVDHDDTLCAIRDCDVFLRTTHYDGDAVSVRESLFLGKPVVATDNGMRPPGVYLVPVGNLDALHAAIDARLADAAPARIPPSHNDENLEAVLQLYREVL